MAAYVRYQMREEDSWAELRPQFEQTDNGNSHSPTLAAYQRMLAAYRKLINDRDRTRRTLHLLTVEELQQIADASIRPSHRKP